MPKTRKTLPEECHGFLKRHDRLASRRKRNLKVYLASLEERFASIDYSLIELRRLAGLSGQSTTDTHHPFEDHRQKRDFYASCFWTFAYSVFDVLAHIVNAVHPAVTDESKVSFLRASHGYNKLQPRDRGQVAIPNGIQDQIRKTTNRQYFKRLAAYRQCCLHRRAVCVAEQSTEVSVSIPYVGSTAKLEPSVVTWICDDPADLVAKFAKRRQLEVECETIQKGAEDDVRKILRAL